MGLAVFYGIVHHSGWMQGIFQKILSVPRNIVMDLNSVMSVCVCTICMYRLKHKVEEKWHAKHSKVVYFFLPEHMILYRRLISRLLQEILSVHWNFLHAPSRWRYIVRHENVRFSAPNATCGGAYFAFRDPENARNFGCWSQATLKGPPNLLHTKSF